MRDTLIVLIFFVVPVILGSVAGCFVYGFLAPATFWERAVAFVISVVAGVAVALTIILVEAIIVNYLIT